MSYWFCFIGHTTESEVGVLLLFSMRSYSVSWRRWGVGRDTRSRGSESRIDHWTESSQSLSSPPPIFIYLAAPGLSCGMWDLVPWPGIKPGSPALGAWSLNHWTTREVSHTSILAQRILMDRGFCWTTVQRITKSWTQLKWLTMHTYICVCV